MTKATKAERQARRKACLVLFSECGRLFSKRER
jgi:hypothetical protein